MAWLEQLTTCWNTVVVECRQQLPALQSSLTNLGQSLGLGFGADGGAGSSAVGTEYELNGRRLKVVRLLGEGGYSFVYLARQLPVAPGGGAGGGAGGGGLLAAAAGGARQPPLFALKRVLCGSEEQLREAEQEVAVMRRLRHPCLLRLLEAATQLQRLPEGESRHAVLMLFPVYDEGNLFDFVLRQRQQLEQQRRQQRALAAAPGLASQREEARQQLASLLRIFLQVCAALHAMHRLDLAHRDVKPQNVLLRRRLAGQNGASSAAAGAAGGAASDGSGAADVSAPYDPMPPLAAPREDKSPCREAGASADGGWAAGEWQATGAASGTAVPGAELAAAEIPVEAEGGGQRRQQQQQQQQQAGPGEQWWAARLPGWQAEYEAVLMDFGSTRPALVEVRGRMDAMAVQEDAERQCTAPYRAPELWDVASSCTIDERVDVWSLGCLLYFCLCGQSPFERAVGETGGSLMLAVVNGRLSWPDTPGSFVPEAVKQLVGRCLDTDPATRPHVAEVAGLADRLLASLLV